MTRIRLGVGLYIVSWLPFEPLIVIYAHHYHVANGWKMTTIAIFLLWVVQFIIGLIGIYIVGKAVIKESKKNGYKQAVSNIWYMFLHGHERTT